MSSTLPQRNYFHQEYSIPGGQWKLSGHSRALERTGFLLTGGGARILLDAGVDVPDFSPLDLILVTHSHIDHCNALPMLYRLTRLIIFLPLHSSDLHITAVLKVWFIFSHQPR
jgi:glyoxylase-like metal-dependent hydrolase (beta-lactamase superfamily II)